MGCFLVDKTYHELDFAVTVILFEVLNVRIVVLKRLKFLLKERFIVISLILKLHLLRQILMDNSPLSECPLSEIKENILLIRS